MLQVCFFPFREAGGWRLEEGRRAPLGYSLDMPDLPDLPEMPKSFREASLGRRLWALFLDSFGSWVMATAIEPKDMSKRLFLQMGILFIEIALLTILQGASFGQRAAKIKVIDYSSGGALSIPRILIRTLLIILVLPAIFRSGGRSVHDIIAKSIVVKYYRSVS